MARIIVVDDEAPLRAMLQDFLSTQHYAVRTAGGGPELDRHLAEGGADLIILDVNMPGEDGFSIAQRVRARCSAGIIMLTSREDEASRLSALKLGADDYLPKPFAPRELLARVRSVLRRMPASEERLPTPNYIVLGPCVLDPDTRQLLGADRREIPLSAQEFDLLMTFARHPRQVMSRDRLAELAHGRTLGPDDRSVDIRVTRLRKKIEPDPGQPRFLKTVRGGGYVFEPA